MDDATQKTLIEQLEFVIAAVDEVQRNGRRAQLPKGWRYNEPLHELVVEGPMYLAQGLIRVAIEGGGILATEVRYAAATHNLILSLKVT